MNILANAILNVGISELGRVNIIPLYQVRVVSETGITKKIIVNWTYGKADGEELKFESDIGLVKQAQMTHLNTQDMIKVIVIQDGDVCKKIQHHIVNSDDRDVLFFVWEKSLSEDEVFFHALNLKIGNKMIEPIQPPMLLSETGLTINKPFLEFTADELGLTL